MDKPIKILYTIPNFKTAGSQYVLLAILRNLDKKIVDPYVCIEKFPESVPSEISKNRVCVFKWTGNKFQDVSNFRKLLKDHKIAIVHSWDYKSNYMEPLATRWAGVTYVYTKKNNAWSKRWKLKSWLSHHIAYDNPEMKSRFFDSSLFANKVSFIPHGVDTTLFTPLKKLPDTHFNIGCIGNIGKNKNQLLIIKAIKDLPKQIVLHLYGNEDKTYRSLLDAYIHTNGLERRVYFHGFVENKNIPEVFKTLDLFVLASIQEGLPVSLLEAMAMGVPAISSDSGGGSRYLLEKEHIFGIENADELSEKILKIYHMEAKERIALSKRGIQKVQNNHTLQKEVNAYEQLYLKLFKS